MKVRTCTTASQHLMSGPCQCAASATLVVFVCNPVILPFFSELSGTINNCSRLFRIFRPLV